MYLDSVVEPQVEKFSDSVLEELRRRATDFLQ